jgi:homoserine dehydrogenase
VGDAIWACAGPLGLVRYETTCGAGLPVISTLRSLIDTGDEVIEIVGALSGTFGAIFSDVANGKPFSAAVRSAKEQGYTEPDPRDDLSGLDVARKALILARTMGRRVDLSELEIENLVPEAMRGLSVDDFLARASALDAAMAERAAEAKASGKALKYVATVRPDGPIAVGLRAIGKETVLGALQGPENIISFRTKRYDAYPLNVTGPGAGAAVTAAGVVADVLALATGPLGS